MLRLHATCVAIGSHGVLLLGEPRHGKSDLAMRLIDRGALLVADDQVDIYVKNDQLYATAPESIQGMLEVRGVGIFKMKAAKDVKLSLAVKLSELEWIERLPYPEPYHCLEKELPQLRLFAFEPSAPMKLEMAVAALKDGSMTVGALKE